MINEHDILETINMIKLHNLDIRTVTLSLSLRDCVGRDVDRVCENIYKKITTYAKNLAEYANDLENEYSIPIINKRIAVTPISLIGEACEKPDYVKIAKTLDFAGKEVGVNFIGGFSALVEKGFTKGDRLLIESIPEALAQTDFLCSSVNLASSKAGINMDAVLKMAETIKKSAELTKDRDCIGAAKLVCFCNSPGDNPFMAGAFCGIGEPECALNVGVSGPGVVRAAIEDLPKNADMSILANKIKQIAYKITTTGELVGQRHQGGLPAFEFRRYGQNPGPLHAVKIIFGIGVDEVKLYAGYMLGGRTDTQVQTDDFVNVVVGGGGGNAVPQRNFNIGVSVSHGGQGRYGQSKRKN